MSCGQDKVLYDAIRLGVGGGDHQKYIKQLTWGEGRGRQSNVRLILTPWEGSMQAEFCSSIKSAGANSLKGSMQAVFDTFP